MTVVDGVVVLEVLSRQMCWWCGRWRSQSKMLMFLNFASQLDNLMVIDCVVILGVLSRQMR